MQTPPTVVTGSSERAGNSAARKQNESPRAHSPFTQPTQSLSKLSDLDDAEAESKGDPSVNTSSAAQTVHRLYLVTRKHIEALVGDKSALRERVKPFIAQYGPLITSKLLLLADTYNAYVSGYYHFANLSILTFLCGWLLTKWPLLAVILLYNIVRAWQDGIKRMAREMAQAAKYSIEIRDSLARLGAEAPRSFNDMLGGGWSSIEPQLSQIIRDNMEPILEYYKPAVIDSLKFSRFTLGARPPYIDAIHTSHEEGVTEYQLSVTVAPAVFDAAHEKSNVELVIRAKGVALACIVDSIFFQGNLRFRIQWSPTTFVDVLDVWFTESPTLEFSLRPLTKFLDIMNVPMLKSAIIGGIDYGLSTMVHPNKLHLPLGEWWSTPSQDAINGVLRIHIHDAKGLKNTDILSKSDPFARVIVNDRTVAQTNVINNNLNPHWDEIKFIPLPKPKFVRMLIEICDHDKTSSYTSLGKVDLHLLELSRSEESNGDTSGVNIVSDSSETGPSTNGKASAGQNASSSATQIPSLTTDTEDINKDDFRLDIVDRIFPLLLGKDLDRIKGSIRLDLRWCPLPKPGETVTSVSGVLRITLHQAKNIELGNKLRSPYTEIQMNGEQVFKSHIKRHSNTPIWSQHTDLFIASYQTAKLCWLVRDTQAITVGGDPLLGKLERSVASVISEPSADGWYPLSSELTKGDGKIKLAFTWTPVAVGSSDDVHESSIGIARIKVLRMRDFKVGPTKVNPFVRILTAGKVRSHNRDDVGDSTHTNYGHGSNSSVGSVAQLQNNSGPSGIANGIAAATNNSNSVASIQGAFTDDGTTIDDSMSMYVLIKSLKEKLELEACNRTTGSRIAKASIDVAKYMKIKKDGDIHGLAKVIDEVEFYEGDKYRGKMEIEVSFYEKTSKSFNKDIDAVSGILKVNIHQMRNLPKTVKTFCGVQTDQSNISQHKTPVKRKSNSPVYETSFEVLVKELYHSVLRFVVYDDHSGSTLSDRIMGAVSLFTYDIFEQTKPKWYTLDNGGEISLSFEFCTVNRSFGTRESIDNMGTLTLDLLSGRDFPKTDVMGKSDPYCIVSLDNEQLFKTKPHKRTLNPEWNESVTIPIYDRTSSRLVVQVMDWEKMGVDEPMGMFEIPLVALPKEVDVRSEFPLSSGQGHVTVNLYFTPQRISKPPTNILKWRLDMLSNNMRETMRRARTSIATSRQKSPARAPYSTDSTFSLAPSPSREDRRGSDGNGGDGSNQNKSQLATEITSPMSGSSNENLFGELRSASSADFLSKIALGESTTDDLYTYLCKHNGQNRGGVLITFVEGTDLKAVDKNGLSDPFVKLLIQHPDIGKKDATFKSSTKHKTVGPHWNENFIFLLPQLTNSAQLPPPPLLIVIKVMDRNKIKDHIEIGECTFDLWSVIFRKLASQDFSLDPTGELPFAYIYEDVWLTLQGVATGKLRIKMRMLFPLEHLEVPYTVIPRPAFYTARVASVTSFPALTERSNKHGLSARFTDGLFLGKQQTSSPGVERAGGDGQSVSSSRQTLDERNSLAGQLTPEERRGGTRFKALKMNPFRKADKSKQDEDNI